MGEAPRKVLGDPEFAAIYGRHRRYVTHVLSSRGVRTHETDDALQDVFFTLFRVAPCIDTDVVLRAWLREVAVHVARNRMRTRRRREPYWLVPGEVDECAPSDAAERSPEQATVVREQYLRACSIIDGLVARQRDVIVLSYFEELTADEIAQVTGSVPATVASRLRAARILLRTALRARVNRRRPNPARYANI